MEYSAVQKENEQIQNKEPNFSKIHRILFISCIIFICAIGFVASDIYLPSLPAIADYYHKEAFWAQSTMTAFLITMAVFQIFSGSLSDKFGRKNVLFLFPCKKSKEKKPTF